MAVLLGVGVFFGNRKLDPYRKIAEGYDLSRVGEKEEMSFIHDRGGREIGTMFVENRFSLPLDEIPTVFVNAVLAQEDQRFYEHDGVDRIGVLRAAYLNVRHRSVTQGAGTLTMQLARKSFDLLGEAKRNHWSGMERKIVEAFSAMRIEENFRKEFAGKFGNDQKAIKKATKERVLEMYLNLVPFGSGFYGVRSASLGYFGKEPKDLTVSECASIVACLKNPSRISPLNDINENRVNRDHVLRRMAVEKMITAQERDRMIALPVVVNPQPILRGKSYFYEIVAAQARELVGEEALSRGGYTIRTTLDATVQSAVEESLRERLTWVEGLPGYEHPKYEDFQEGEEGGPKYLQGAALLIDHETGEVIAHVGGRDYAHSQYDFIENGSRSLGTAFFPMVYASAFENGWHPARMVMDEQMDARKLMVGGDLEGVIGEWGMEVDQPAYEGEITARRALAVSKIAATVGLGQEVGLEKIRETATKFGFDFSSGKLLNRMIVGFDEVSLPEVVSAYSTFPRGGTRMVSRRYIREIRDIEGKVVYSLGATEGAARVEAVCSDATAYQVHDVLNEVYRTGNLSGEVEGLATSFRLGGGKTGSSYGFTDAWMAGYQSRVTGAVWVGFYDGGRKTIHREAFAKRVAYPVWEAMMNAAEVRFAGREILMPESLEKVGVCRVSGMRPTRYCHELVVGDGSGEVQYRSTSYPEFLRRGEELGICVVHGEGVDVDALAEQALPQKVVMAVPIKSQVPLLLGFDPYQSETPTLVPTDDEAEAWSLYGDVIVVEDQVRGEREALLNLERPGRFRLPDLIEVDAIE